MKSREIVQRSDDGRMYKQVARAEAAAATHERIVRAFLDMAVQRWYDEITLADVARASGVTVQTVIRRFGSKEQLFEAASKQFHDDVVARRKPHIETVDGAIDALVDDYEVAGDMLVRTLALEERFAILKGTLDNGRKGHRTWVEQTFSRELAQRKTAARESLVRKLITVTDVYVWKLLRRDMGLTSKATGQEILALVRGVLH
ncbi:TetR/AcrR family transcriptional regulator [Paraburkholderia sp. IW21]|uniref:TetR/AcrR family transcriptional regulator n=1 Tax=Paraburkholderia sp. IW21 TaxID=3242488 RepID=UPI00351FBAB2